MSELGFSLPLTRDERIRTNWGMNLIQTLEAEQIAKLTAVRAIPEFRPGDTLKVGVKDFIR
jgi:ribosomal protein L19